MEVSLTDANTGTVVEGSGTILHISNGGSGWISQTSGTTSDLSAVSFTDANIGTVVGESGTILHTTDAGVSWAIQTSGTTEDLYGVSFTNATTGTAVGSNGAIVRTTDGERTGQARQAEQANVSKEFPSPMPRPELWLEIVEQSSAQQMAGRVGRAR